MKKNKEQKEISQYDSKGEHHGYQEWFSIGNLWFRGVYKHGDEIGYNEYNPYCIGIGKRGTKVEFYIR